MTTRLIIQHKGLCDYKNSWEAMKAFTDQRDAHTLDELWLLQHPPVFTQGQAGKAEHIRDAHTIPIVQSDRGGQVTYHGPGQLVAYLLADLRRLKLSPRQLVSRLENSVIELLADLHLKAHSRCEAPGVYVDEAKIASIGLRVRKGCSYHGLALNVDMDLTPFSYINPCGYHNLAITQLRDLKPELEFSQIEKDIIPYILKNFGYNSADL